jgi:ATPase involved in DNA replication initiation
MLADSEGVSRPLPPPPACRPQSPTRRAAALVAAEMDVSIHLIFHASRCQARTARARQLAMYLAHVVLGQSLTAIGEAFGRDRTTVSYACNLIEDLRDDKSFDSAVERLEMLLEAEGRGDAR